MRNDKIVTAMACAAASMLAALTLAPSPWARPTPAPHGASPR